MTKETIILDSKGEQYIQDVLKVNGMTDLPDNVILNKVTTGSGMTTAAIISPVPYVIAVPLKRLVENKLQWCKTNNINMLGVYAYNECGVGVKEIEEFTGNVIMTTYDSLHKVVEALTNNGRIKDFKIMIDESHHIIRSGNFRYGAIESVLNSYTKFKAFIFGTATPVEDKYQHPKLKDIQKVQIKWYDLKPVTVNYCAYYENLLKASAIAVIDHLNGKMNSNGHFFINSVTDIVTILRYVIKGGYNDPSRIRIITAGSDENEAKLIAGLGKGYRIADVNSPSNVINFYTATCFDGIDFYDEIGLPYIISDGSKEHSKIDILIQLPQIIGRIRDTKYSNFVNLLYSPNRFYSHTTEDEFEIYTKARLEDAKRYVERYENETEDMIKEALYKAAKENVYLQVIEEENKIILNETALYSEMQNYKTLHTTYYHTSKEKADQIKVVEKTIFNNDIEYKYNPMDGVEITGLDKAKLGKKANFSSVCELYNEASCFERAAINKVYPIISEAYNVLGFKAIKALKFRQEDIKNELLKVNKLKTVDFKIANLLNYRVGQWISREEVKESLQKIYADFGIYTNAKATDLLNYYDVKESSKRVENIHTRGYVIMMNKFKTN